MDYAEKALIEMIERFSNMSTEKYEEVYNSAISKMKRKDILQSCIDVKKSENIKSYKKNISYFASNIPSGSGMVAGYEKSESERCRQWAA